ITINHMETIIIDTKTYQRLRKIRQLGTTHLVYPGAEHSRFQHSLGVVFMTSYLIEKIKKNRFSKHRVFSSYHNIDNEKEKQQNKSIIRDENKQPLQENKIEKYASKLINNIFTYVLKVTKFVEPNHDDQIKSKELKEKEAIILKLCKDMYGEEIWDEIMDKKF